MRVILTALLLGIFFMDLSAQQLAFPGAEGAGRFTTGGRGTPAIPTTVFEVTNLNDDNNPGSLRYALSQSAASRTVIFRVSGTIHLTSNLNIRANTTIAGQTAPGDGICIADKPLTINGDNIIVRYIRVRLGDRYQQATNGNDDAFSGTGRKHIIIDHCTMSWSDDETFTVYDGDSTTAQWNIISEPLNFSYHDEGSGIENHGYGGIWGGRKASFHHNLIVSCVGRMPRFNGSRTLSPFTPGLENVDFRNNVIYNWGSYNVNGGEGGNYNVVNNYYKYGPNTSAGTSSGIPTRNMVINPGRQTSAPVLPYGQYYLTGNYVDGSAAITQNNWLGAAMSGGTQNDTTQAKVLVPFDLGPVTTHTAQEAYNLVLQYAGASFVRDTLDQRIVGNVMNRTGRIIDVQGGYPHGTPYANTVNAWPTLNSAAAPTDTDHDGMPDAYETANGLNPNDALDRAVVAGNGYTNLENYMNGILTAANIQATSSMIPFVQNIPLVSQSQSYVVSATSLSGDLTITPPANFQVSADGGTTWSASPVIVSQVGGTIAPTTINVRLNASSAGSYSGSITHSSIGAPVTNVAVSGTAYASSAPPGTSLVVAQDGTGDYTTVQAAINAAPTGRTTPYVIFIKNGKYFEKITIPSNKPFIHLVGESVANVILYYKDGASDPLPGGGTVGTQNSASFTVNANDFAAFNITFANSYGDGTQAVAVLVNADRAVFQNCRFLGNQDTLYIKGSGTPRHYFKDCYIDGNVDFIFGSSIALFDSCVIYPKSRTTSGSSYITAANTPPGQAYGYVFRNCEIPNNTGATTYVLGRPWQNSTGSSPLANNKVVFLNTSMGTTISPAGWSTWDAGTNTNLIYYGEYQSKFFNGTPVNISSRVPWSFQLSAAEAATYTNANLFGAWDPCLVSSSVCANTPRDIAVSNFRGTKGASNSTFDWNISWAMDQIKYELYRSAVRNSVYTKIDELTATNDTAINFQLTDAHPAAGGSYFYYLAASKAGYASHITDTVEISSIPVINTDGTLQPFIQNLGSPATSQNATVSGANLLGNVVLTPPVNFEISSDGGATWIANPTTISLTPAANTLAATTIGVRLNASSAGPYLDSIMLTTTGGITKYIRVEGTTAVIAASTTVTLLHWPFTLNANDSTNVRATGVLPSTPVFNNLYSSNGTTPPAMPAYSPQFGQAFGATANGDGSWGTGAGGPGGTLRRTFWEQFNITPDAGYTVQVDSIYITGAFYNTSSNTRLAVVYSKSNFTTDSSDVFTIPGGFANPAAMLNQTAGPTQEYALSVAGLGGVTLQPGETLSFRLYFSCGSSSNGRYAMLKNVKLVGKSELIPVPVAGLLQHWPFTQNASDSANVRSAGVTASTPVFNKLYVSNGTTPPALPPYSAQFGQAFGATANGDGSWGTGAGGPGGNLNRTYYEQFTVTASTGSQVRIDSIYATAAFYNTSSGTRLGVVYSLSNFTTDSADVSASPGGFATPVALANQTGGPTNEYKLLVNPAGVTILPGQTITFRLYFSCSSSSAGRYAMLKDVKVIGLVSPFTGPAPAISAAGSLSNFVQITTATPSAVQTYTVSGSNLNGDITITPPADYQVSADGGTTWFNNATPLVLTATAGSVANTTISVRLNATALGAHNGNITHSSTGAPAVNVAVNGNTVPTPNITTTGTLNAFSHTVGIPSAVQTYTVGGTSLLGNITITPPVNFEVSADNGTTWFTNASPLTLTPTGGTIASTTISVRMNAGAAGPFSGTIAHTGTSAATVNVAVSGTAIPAPLITVTGALTPFTQILSVASASQTYTVAGSNLTDNIRIAAPANFEISSDGGTTWSTTPITLTRTGGTIAATTIAVRLFAGATGPFSGIIEHTSVGAVTRSLAVTGTTVPKPSIIVTQSLTPFTQLLPDPSPSQSYTVSGTNLAANVTITPPQYFQVSIDNGGSWQSTPVVLPRTGTTMTPVTVLLRLNAPITGIFERSLRHESSFADPIVVNISGAARLSEDYAIYPVPAYTTIFMAHPMTAQRATLVLYNLSGQQIATFVTQPNTVETPIDIRNLPQGMYYLKYTLEDKKVQLSFIKY